MSSLHNIYIINVTNNSYIIYNHTLDNCEMYKATSNYNHRNELEVMIHTIKIYPLCNYYIDSYYINNIIKYNVKRWSFNNYKTKDNKPLRNKDLIQKLLNTPSILSNIHTINPSEKNFINDLLVKLTYIPVKLDIHIQDFKEIYNDTSSTEDIIHINNNFMCSIFGSNFKTISNFHSLEIKTKAPGI